MITPYTPPPEVPLGPTQSYGGWMPHWGQEISRLIKDRYLISEFRPPRRGERWLVFVAPLGGGGHWEVSMRGIGHNDPRFILIPISPNFTIEQAWKLATPAPVRSKLPPPFPSISL